MAIALREGRPINGMEAAAERPDGTRVPFMAFPSPLRDAAGEIVGGVNMLVDITERKHAEQVGQRLVSIIESSDDAIVSKDFNGLIISWNRGAERLFGYAAEEVIGKPITILIPPDRHSEETKILERIRRGERVDHYETTRQRKNGSLVEISLTVSPVRNAEGRIVGASKIARDITERKQSEERITLLAHEVDHRSKNLLAMVQATVHLTKGDTPDALKTAIEGRLQALANAHALLAQSRWAGADLRSLVAEELSPYCQEGGQRARINGPTLTLEPETAQSIAMAVHELTTNAVKYGALSAPTGHVQVEWSRSSGRTDRPALDGVGRSAGRAAHAARLRHTRDRADDPQPTQRRSAVRLAEGRARVRDRRAGARRPRGHGGNSRQLALTAPAVAECGRRASPRELRVRRAAAPAGRSVIATVLQTSRPFDAAALAQVSLVWAGRCELACGGV